MLERILSALSGDTGLLQGNFPPLEAIKHVAHGGIPVSLGGDKMIDSYK